MTFVNESGRYHDPIAQRAMGLGDIATDAATGAAIGSVVPGVGTAVGGAAGFVSGAVSAIRNLFHSPNTDPASQIWKHIAPSASMVIQALNVAVGNDGKWYDAGTHQLLSQEDADFRAESLMAQLVGSHMGSQTDRYWYDNADNHRLTSQESFARWTANYGSAATLESVLESGKSYTPDIVPAHNTPIGQQVYQTPYRPTPSPGGPAITHANLIPGISNTPVLLAALAIVGFMVLKKRR